MRGLKLEVSEGLSSPRTSEPHTAPRTAPHCLMKKSWSWVSIGHDVGFDPDHPAPGRPHPEPFHEAVDGLLFALGEQFNGSLRGVPHPAVQTEPASGHPGCLAIPDPLYPASHDGPNRFHGRTSCPNCSLLTSRAEERRPRPHHDPFDRSAAPTTGLPFAPVHPKTFEVSTGPPVRKEIRQVVQRSSSGGDSGLENGLDRGSQLCHFRAAHGAARPGRPDPGPIENLVRVDVAKSGDDPLIEQERLDRARCDPPTSRSAAGCAAGPSGHPVRG